LTGRSTLDVLLGPLTHDLTFLSLDPPPNSDSLIITLLRVCFNGLTITHTIATHVTTTRIKETILVVLVGVDVVVTFLENIIVYQRTHRLGEGPSKGVYLAGCLLILVCIRTRVRCFPGIGEGVGCQFCQTVLFLVVILGVCVVVSTETLQFTTPGGLSFHVNLGTPVPEYPDTTVPSHHEIEPNLGYSRTDNIVMMGQSHIFLGNAIICPRYLPIPEH